MASDLIERLKAATEGSAELDRAIGEVTGRGYFEQPCLGAYCYTRSIDTAVTLIPPGEPWNIGLETSNLHGIAWVSANGPFMTAATPALALCIAALMAREAE